MNIKNILVALDLSDFDDHLIQYASDLAQLIDAENVYFVHNIKQYEISEIFAKRMADINLEDVIYEQLDEKVNKLFSANVNKEVLISEDPYTENLLTYITNRYQIDLVLLGNKNNIKGTGTVTGKLLRLLKSDVLLVPAGAKVDYKNLICTTDFSKNSQKGIFKAVALAKDADASVSCLNVFKIPQAYFPYIKNMNSALKEVKTHSQKQYDKMWKRMKLTTPPEVVMSRAGDMGIAERIRTEAIKKDADILFISDKGRSSIVSLLIGSVTEELFTSPIEIPLWIAK